MTASAGKKILMLVENNPYSEDIRVKREARALVAAGCDVTVICPGTTKKKPNSAGDGVKVYAYPAPPGGKGILGYVWEYGYSLVMMFFLSLVVWLRGGFDVVHAHNPPDMLVFIGAFYKLMGKKFVFDHHDLSPEMIALRYSGTKQTILRNTLVWLEQLSCRVADHVIATNQSYKDMEMARSGLSAERITIVRNGPSEKMQPVAPDPELRSRAGTLIGYVGIMGPQDGIDYLLRAIQQLVYTLKMDDVYCVIIGKSNYLKELKELAAELGISDKVWFTGWISYADLLRYLSTVDICVAPDPSNPFNDRCTMIKMMEYMAMGKPIVAFDLPEHRVTAGEAATYARGNDELDFATRIMALANNPQQREAMGKSGRNRIQTELAWSFQIPKLTGVYAQLTETSGKAQAYRSIEDLRTADTSSD